MEVSKPSAAHARLNHLVGRWTGTETLQPSPWDAKGGTATATLTNRAELGGYVVVQDYVQHRNRKVSFRGHGVFSYDTAREQYVMHWWDSSGMPVSEYRGNFAGEVLTLTTLLPQGGQSRASFDLAKAGRYAFRMDVTMDGSKWQSFMEASYTKTK